MENRTKRLSRDNSLSPCELDLCPTQIKPINDQSHKGEQL